MRPGASEGSSHVLRWTADGYLIALVAGRGDDVRAPPFDAVEIDVGWLFGDDEEPLAPEEPPAGSGELAGAGE